MRQSSVSQQTNVSWVSEVFLMRQDELGWWESLCLGPSGCAGPIACAVSPSFFISEKPALDRVGTASLSRPELQLKVFQWTFQVLGTLACNLQLGARTCAWCSAALVCEKAWTAVVSVLLFRRYVWVQAPEITVVLWECDVMRVCFANYCVNVDSLRSGLWGIPSSPRRVGLVWVV